MTISGPNRRGLIAGFLVIGVFVVSRYLEWILAAFVQVAGIDDLPFYSVISLAIVVLSEIAMAVIVAASALNRRGVVVVLLVGALLLRSVTWVVIAAQRFNLDALRPVIRWYFDYPWLWSVVFGLAFTLFMAAWFCGRRTSLIPLALAPVAGAMAASGSWGVSRLFAQIWRPDLGSDWVTLGYLFVTTTLDVIVLGVVAVGFAWLGHLLDKSVSGGRVAPGA